MALNGRPSRQPPPHTSTSSRMVRPIGNSYMPTWLIEPMRVNILVPLLFSVPIEENHSAPLMTMWGTHDMVSVLFTTVGRLNRPASTERGGLVRGMARLPSMPNMSADASPEMYAPPPICTSTWQVKPEPMMLSPSSPASYACCTAILVRWIASGYSSPT